MTDSLFKNIEHLKIIQLKRELIETRHEISLQNEAKILLLAEMAKLTAELEQERLTEAIQPPDKQYLVAETVLAKLTRRQREVIVMLGQGASNKEIAQSLDLVEATVKVHVQGILRKLNLSNRVQVALLAVKCGLGASSH